VCKLIFFPFVITWDGVGLEVKGTLLKMYTSGVTLLTCCDNYSVSILNMCFKVQYIYIYMSVIVIEFRATK
jgi:hypothetical protein